MQTLMMKICSLLLLYIIVNSTSKDVWHYS